MIDPDQFVISRKRKKYKFAKFANSPLCFEYDQWRKQTVEVLEVGAGTGLFGVELASRYPDKQVVAIDVKADRLQKGAYEAEARHLTNIRFLRARADQLAELFTADSTEAIWLTFPDPFPKKRSAGRRMTHRSFLSVYSHLLKKQGSLHIKHDNQDFFHWSLEQLVADRWHIQKLTFNLHESELPDDYKVLTTYEKRWTNEGLTTQLVSATPVT